MAEELEKTCENCKYDYEDMEGTHCRHCIHNAEERFEPKVIVSTEKEIRAKVIDEFAERLQDKVESFQAKINGFKADVLTLDYFVEFVDEIAEELKGVRNEVN